MKHTKFYKNVKKIKKLKKITEIKKMNVLSYKYKTYYYAGRCNF